jgi:membrane protein required for colicin V production
MDFSIFDLIVGSIILLLGLKGILNGFFKELFGLIGIVGGIFVGSRVANEVGTCFIRVDVTEHTLSSCPSREI